MNKFYKLLFCIPILGFAMVVAHVRDPHSGRVVVFGDSHAQCGIDPRYIDATCMGRSSETLKYTYLKARECKSEKIILCLGFHSFSDYLIEFDYSANVQARYLPLENTFEMISLNRHRLNVFGEYAVSSVLVGLKSRRESFWGGFNNTSGRTWENDSLTKIRVLQQFSGGIYDNHYLELISALGDVTIVLLPVHPRYYELIPEKFKAYTLKRLSGFKVIDLSRALSEDSLFLPDGDHLSPAGAEVTSRLLNQKI